MSGLGWFGKPLAPFLIAFCFLSIAGCSDNAIPGQGAASPGPEERVPESGEGAYQAAEDRYRLLQLEDRGRQKLGGEARSGRFRQGTRAVEIWRQSFRKDRIVSLQSAQERPAHSGTYLGFGERAQCPGENECVPTGSPCDDGTAGTVWPYRRHISDYAWNLNAVPAFAAGDVIAGGFTPVSSARFALSFCRWALG